MVGDMCGVVIDEVAHEPVNLRLLERPPLRRQAVSNHRTRAAADHVARHVVGDGRQPIAGENDVERGDEVGGAVDQRAIEIENDGGSNQRPRSLPAGARNGKPAPAVPWFARGSTCSVEGGEGDMLSRRTALDRRAVTPRYSRICGGASRSRWMSKPKNVPPPPVP